MNYIKPEDIKAYVEQNPTGIAGMSEALAAMVNHFAETTVKECISVVDSLASPDDSDDYYWTVQNTSSKLKEHFGVEE